MECEVSCSSVGYRRTASEKKNYYYMRGNKKKIVIGNLWQEHEVMRAVRK